MSRQATTTSHKREIISVFFVCHLFICKSIYKLHVVTGLACQVPHDETSTSMPPSPSRTVEVLALNMPPFIMSVSPIFMPLSVLAATSKLTHP